MEKLLEEKEEQLCLKVLQTLKEMLSVGQSEPEVPDALQQVN